jgi:hypothetical protein
MHLLRAESPGPQVGKLVTKMKATARILYLIYLGLTVLQVIVLMLDKPIPGYESEKFFFSLLTAFGCAGTGGFGFIPGSMELFHPFSQYVIAIFLLLYGINFSLYYLILIGKLKDVFGIWNEETDSLPEGMKNSVSYNGKNYDVVHVCDLIHSTGAEILGEYQSDFYAGMPALTENSYGNGKAYYAAFRNDDDFTTDFCSALIEKIGIAPDTDIEASSGIEIRKRGNTVFVLNFSDAENEVTLDKEYINVITDEKINGEVKLPVCGYLVLK